MTRNPLLFCLAIAVTLLAAPLSANPDESGPKVRVKSPDPAIQVESVGFEAKQRSTGSHQIRFRFSITNKSQEQTKNGQLFFKTFDKEGFELTNPGHLYEARTILEPGEVRKATSEQFFEAGEWEKVRNVEFFWKPLEFLDKKDNAP